MLTKLLQNALGGNSKTVMVGVHDLISSHASLTRSWVGFCSGAVGLFWCVFFYMLLLLVSLLYYVKVLINRCLFISLLNLSVTGTRMLL